MARAGAVSGSMNCGGTSSPACGTSTTRGVSGPVGSNRSNGGRMKRNLAWARLPGSAHEARGSRVTTLRAGVGLGVRLADVIRGYVGVDLGRPQVGVTEHRLHRAQVGAAAQQVGREGVPELVGRGQGDDPGRHGVAANDAPE